MWRPVLMINGFIMLVLGMMMMVPAIAPYYFDENPDYIFMQNGLAVIFLGGALFLANFGQIQKISILQGYLITVISWFVAPLVCAFPFLHNGTIDTFHDALFEATAGIAATGATILDDVEIQPKSILLWRSMLNGLGGIGIIIFAVALSPFLGTGGMHLFNRENSDTEEKFLPKMRYIANDIIIAYVLLNILCAGLLKFFGMEWFDAITWAMATLSTGGFSIKNDSILSYQSFPIEATIAFFMLMGALPITYFVLLGKNKNMATLRGNSQINTLFKLIIVYTLVLGGTYAYQTETPLWQALWVVLFNIIAAITTAGIYTADYTTWGSWAVIAFLVMFLHGGCTGSTTGSIKIFRWQVVFSFLRQHIKKSLFPNQVVMIKIGDKVIHDNIVFSVFALVLSFLLAIAFFSVVLCFCGVDFMTAFGAVIANITGVGAGLTENIGPNGNFGFFSPFVKYVLSFVMVLGRLEVITVVVLASKIKWK